MKIGQVIGISRRVAALLVGTLNVTCAAFVAGAKNSLYETVLLSTAQSVEDPDERRLQASVKLRFLREVKQPMLAQHERLFDLLRFTGDCFPETAVDLRGALQGGQKIAAESLEFQERLYLEQIQSV